MHQKITLFLVLFIAGIASASAQSSSYSTSTTIDISTDRDLLELDDNNWAVYADEDNKLYYIDFESLSMNLSDIVVRRESGEVVLREDVFELPVDTIYEIDFNQFGTGTYKIELRSFTSELSRTVTVK